MSCSNPFRIPVLLLAILCSADVYAQGPPGFFHPQQNSTCPPPTTIDRYIGEQVPDIWDESEPIERFLTAVAQRSRLDIEYLHWNFDSLPSSNIGAPITDVADPLTPFQVFENLNGAASAGLAIVPSTSSLISENISGVRGRLGVDLNQWTLEGIFFGTEQSESDLLFPSRQGRRVTGLEAIGTPLLPNVVTPLTTSGTPTARTAMNSFVYDRGFQASLDSQLWGAEILLLKELYLPQEAFNWQWLGGFRYVSFDEDYAQIGRFNNGGTLAVDRVTNIGSGTVNNVYGPQVGGRASLRTKYVTLSATPRIAFALNDHTSTVATGPLTVANEPVVRVTQESIDFTPIVEVNLKMQIHLTSNFSVFGGYDLLYMLDTSRATENIVYDSLPGPGAGFLPNIGQQVRLTDFLAYGFNVGGRFTY